MLLSYLDRVLVQSLLEQIQNSVLHTGDYILLGGTFHLQIGNDVVHGGVLPEVRTLEGTFPGVGPRNQRIPEHKPEQTETQHNVTKHGEKKLTKTS